MSNAHGWTSSPTRRGRRNGAALDIPLRKGTPKTLKREMNVLRRLEVLTDSSWQMDGWA
jgi:hypothetical protein